MHIPLLRWLRTIVGAERATHALETGAEECGYESDMFGTGCTELESSEIGQEWALGRSETVDRMHIFLKTRQVG
jgi:hypothetical protein